MDGVAYVDSHGVYAVRLAEMWATSGSRKKLLLQSLVQNLVGVGL
jgi:hypothetical protein